jgi:uncharacterized membrane protein YeaQ/YmgE (transglycosylase-associated protein family)
MDVIAWIVAGAVAGWLAGLPAPLRLPGGGWAAAGTGMAGGFVGGGTAALVAGGDVAAAEPLAAVAAAVAGAVLLMLMLATATRTQPRTARPARTRDARALSRRRNGDRSPRGRRRAPSRSARMGGVPNVRKDRRR